MTKLPTKQAPSKASLNAWQHNQANQNYDDWLEDTSIIDETDTNVTLTQTIEL